MNRKTQISIEFMMVVGFAMLLIIPGIYFFYTQVNDSTFAISSSRTETIANNVIQQVEYVYPQARNTFTTIDFLLPEQVVNMTVLKRSSSSLGNDLVFEMDLGGMTHHIVVFTRYPIFIGTCENPNQLLPGDFFTSGQKSLRMRSCDGNVSIFYHE